jgi:uncharacterized protein (TIGR03118 family)
VGLLAMAAILVGGRVVAAADEGTYQQTNLVSDQSGVAALQDASLVNAWGLVSSSTSPFWVSDNGTGLSTLYTGAGAKVPLTVTVPPPAGSPAGTTSAPTGDVFNGISNEFVVSNGTTSGASVFMFATEDGTISGWNPGVDRTHAILAVDNSGSAAVYKGLAIATSSAGDHLYATNFRQARIDVFNTSFGPVTMPAGAFSDPMIPAGYAPFGIRNIGGLLYVTYAMQDAARHDDVAGVSHGFIDVYTPDGALVQRFARHGLLNSPWGLAMAPANFGQFSGDLLVGNFGDGHINAYTPSGELLGPLHGVDGRRLTIDGLWALSFGNGAAAGPTNTLFFTAGPDGETHGLFGTLTVATP